MQVIRLTITVIAIATLYCLIYQLNKFAFSQLLYSHGVTWIYLPSGLRMVLVLVLGVRGALGIGLGSLVLRLAAYPDVDIVYALGSAVISGASPLLALWICQHRFKLDVEMTDLSASTLLKMTVIFAIVNSLLHQTWYFWQGHTGSPMSSLLVMMVGDFVGTIILLYAARLLMALLPRGSLSK